MKNRASTVAGLIENYQTIDEVIKAAQNSEGSAQEELNKYLEGIDGKLQKLTNTVQEFWTNVIDSELLKTGLDLITGLVSGVTQLVSKFGALPPILGIITGYLSTKNILPLKTINSEADTFLAKIGIANRSFQEYIDSWKARQSDIQNIVNSINPNNGLEKWQAKKQARNQVGSYASYLSQAESLKELQNQIIVTRKQAESLKHSLAVYDAFDENSATQMLSTIKEFAGKIEATKDATDGSKVTWNDYFETLQEGQGWVKNLIQQNDVLTLTTEELTAANNAARASYARENAQLEALITTSKIAKVALGALKTVLISLAASLVFEGIQKAIEWLDKKVIHRLETIAEEAENARNKIAELKDEFKSIADTTNDVKDRFAELAQGVKNLGLANQSNGSLTPDEYDEFLDLSNQLAELYPELVKHYDDNGNAILRLSGDVQEITTSIDDLLDKQREATTSSINEEMPSIWKQYTEDLKTYQKELDKYNKILDSDNRGKFVSKDKDLDEKITEALKKAKIDLDTSTGYTMFDMKKLYTVGDRSKKGYYTTWDFSALSSEQYNAFKKYFDTSIFEKELNDYKDEIKTEASTMASDITTWLSSDQAMVYQKLKESSPDLASAISEALLNGDWVSNLPDNVNIEDWDEVAQWIEDNFTSAIATLQDDPKIANAFVKVFTEQNISANEKLNLLNQIISKFGLDSGVEVVLRPVVEETEKKNNQYNDIRESLKKEYSAYKGELNKWIDGLSEEQLETLTNIDSNKFKAELEKQSKSILNAEKGTLGSLKNNITEEWKKLSDFGLTEYSKEIREGTVQTKFGNVDMDKRTIIKWSDELKKTYADALASWEYDPKIGSIDTVFSKSNGFTALDGSEWTVAFTPVLPDGTFLSKDAVYDYIQQLLNEAYSNDGNITEDELVALDAQGRQIGDTFVQGIFAGISEGLDKNNNATIIGKLMQFVGKFGSFNVGQQQIKGYNKALQNFTYTVDNLQTAFDNLTKTSTEATVFSIADYAEDIDGFQENLEKLSTAYTSLVNGNFSSGDALDLIQEFPTLANETDDLESAIKNLIENSLNDLYDKLGENVPTYLKDYLRDLTNQATQTVTTLNDAYSAISSTYEVLYDMQEAMDNGGTLTSSLLSSISGLSSEMATAVAEYNVGLMTSADLFDLLKEHYQTDLQNYTNLILAKNQFSETFYENMGLNSAEIINKFADDYDIDLSNCKNYAEAKAEIEMQTLGQIEGNWRDYYNTQTKAFSLQYKQLRAIGMMNKAKGVSDSQNVALQQANLIGNAVKTYEAVTTAYDQAISKRVDVTFQKTQRDIKAADEAASASADSAKEQEVQWKDLMDKEIALEKARFDAGVISYKDYMDKRLAITNKYYNEEKITAEEYYTSLQEMYEEQLSIYDKVLSAISSLIDEEIDKLDKSTDAINKKNDALNEEKEKYDNIISAVEDVYDTEIDRINELIDALEEQNDKLSEEQENYDNILSAIDKVYDDQIKVYEDEQQKIQDIIDGLQDANDEREREIALMKAKYELERAQNQRTQYVYQDGQMVYKADETAIRDAKDALRDAELNKTIADLEKQIEEIDKNIDALEKMKEKWQEIANARKEALEYQAGVDMFGDKFTEYILNSGDKDIDAFLEKYNKVLDTIDDNTELIKGYNEKIKYYEKLKKNWTDLSSQHEKNINKQIATEKFGAEWEKKVLEGRLEDFDSFKNRYLVIQDEVTNNEKLLKDLEEKKTYYEELKNQWSSVSSAYEEGMNKQIAAMILGQDWERDILNNREGMFEDFKNNYINIQHQIANATIDAANAAVNAAQAEAQAVQNALGSTVGYINTVSDEYKKAAKDMEDSIKNLGNQQEALNKVIDKKAINNNFGTISKYAKGGVINESEDSNIRRLANSVGEDTLIFAKEGERVLTKEQNENFEALLDNKSGSKYVPVDMTKMFGRLDVEKFINGAASQLKLFNNAVRTNSKPEISGYVNEVNVDQHITLTLPNVTNNSGVEYLQKTLSNMTQKAYQMINKH